MPTWFWFAIAVLAAAGGAMLLLSDRARAGGHSRDRRRWAEEKSWEFAESDPVLPSRWRYGAVHQGGPGRALDLATGAVPGPGGRRLAHVFDHEQAGQVTGVVAAVRGVAALPVALELRLPSAPLPDDAELDSLGQVGDRYAFVTDVAEARPLATADLARAADDVGSDVPLLWAEESWVLATVAAGTDPERVQALLQSLVEVSVALEEAVDAADADAGGGDGATGDAGPAEPEGAPAADDRARDDRARDDGARDDGARDDGARDDRAVASGTSPASSDEPSASSSGTSSSGTSSSESRPTHRDRPEEIPFDIEDDGFGPGARSGSSTSGR